MRLGFFGFSSEGATSGVTGGGVLAAGSATLGGMGLTSGSAGFGSIAVTGGLTMAVGFSATGGVGVVGLATATGGNGVPLSSNKRRISAICFSNSVMRERASSSARSRATNSSCMAFNFSWPATLPPFPAPVPSPLDNFKTSLPDSGGAPSSLTLVSTLPAALCPDFSPCPGVRSATFARRLR